jgi:hypothetical protein
LPLISTKTTALHSLGNLFSSLLITSLLFFVLFVT